MQNKSGSTPQAALSARLGGRKKPLIIGVAGDSGSGKSTYTQGIEWLLGSRRVSQISLDGYHAEDRAARRASGQSPLDPSANRLALAVEHLSALRQGKAVDIPIYNHANGCFEASQRYEPTPIIVVEGLHTLYPDFLPLLDFAIYVDTDAPIKHAWKHHRDTRERGYAQDEAHNEITRRSEHYTRWIADQEAQADVILRIHPSELGRFALGELAAEIPDTCYHLEVIVKPGTDDQPALYFPVDLNNMTRDSAMPFMLATVPSHAYGQPVNVLHVDGHMPPAALETLEQEICAFAGLDAPAGADHSLASEPSTIRFAQMLLAWPVLGLIDSLSD